jgi:hypothetical protein
MPLHFGTTGGLTELFEGEHLGGSSRSPGDRPPRIRRGVESAFARFRTIMRSVRPTFLSSAARGFHVPAKLTPEPAKREARKRRASERPRVGCCEELAGYFFGTIVALLIPESISSARNEGFERFSRHIPGWQKLSRSVLSYHANIPPWTKAQVE